MKRITTLLLILSFAFANAQVYVAGQDITSVRQTGSQISDSLTAFLNSDYWQKNVANANLTQIVSTPDLRFVIGAAQSWGIQGDVFGDIVVFDGDGAVDFSVSPTIPAPTGDYSAATKLYVDNAVAGGGSGNVPNGGTQYQALGKNSATDQDVGWYSYLLLDGSNEMTGGLDISSAGSSNASPVTFGVNGWENVASAARFLFGDTYNMIQSGNGEMMDIASYNTIRIIGARQDLDGGQAIEAAGDETSAAVLMPQYEPDRSIVFRANATPDSALVKFEDSAKDVMSFIDADDGSFNGEVSYDNTTSGLTATKVAAAIDELAEHKTHVDSITTDSITLDDTYFVNDGKKVFTLGVSTSVITVPSSITYKTPTTFQVRYVDSTMLFLPDTGVTFIGNGNAPIVEGFVLDSLNMCNILPLGGGLFSVTGYVKAYTTPTFDPPPLNDNPNPEILQNASAHTFPPYEADAVSFESASYPPVNSTATSIAEGGHGYGDYTMKLQSTSGTFARARHHLTSLTGGEVYEYVLVYRMQPNANNSNASDSGRFTVICDNSGTLVDVDNLSATTWTELSGEFTYGGSDTYAQLAVWAANTDGEAGDIIEYKLTLKLKND